MRSLPSRLLLALVLAVLALPVVAQAPQYTAPGGATAERPRTKEDLEKRMEEARWRVGPLRLAPWLAVRRLTWEEDVFVQREGREDEATSDLTGSVGAGLTAYLPTGPKLFWVAQAMPEYLWWLDLSERNQWVGRYGAGVYADLNRLRIGVNGRRSEQQQVVTPEEPLQVLSDQRTASANAELDLADTLTLRVSGSRIEVENRLPDADGPGADLPPGVADFTRLDREERALRGELSYRPREPVEVALGVEATETDFATGARDLSSTGTSPYLSLRLDGHSLSLDSRVVRRELEPEPGSDLRAVDATEGQLRLRFTPGWRFTFGLYGHRSTVYALDLDYSHLTDQRLGVELSAPFGERLTVRAFTETGDAEYEPLPGSPARTDDVTAWGAEASFRLGEWLSYRAGFQQVSYDSNLPGFDRDLSRVTSSVVLSTGDWIWN